MFLRVMERYPAFRFSVHFSGWLLDVLLDYRLLADRIIYGTLSEVLAQSGHPPPSRDAFTPPEPENAEDDAEEND